VTDDTCWTVIRGAGEGDAAARLRFVEQFGDSVRAYLGARWRGRLLAQDVDDAVQDVFVECFREGGALMRSTPDRPGGFRPFLLGVVRNVARRREERDATGRRRAGDAELHPSDVPSDERSLAQLFDRRWAEGVMRRAGEEQLRQAGASGPAALRRVELLRLRFEDGLPLREIAARWAVEPADVHHEYARARAEFHAALRRVVAFERPGTPGEVERECVALLDLLA